MSMFATIDLEKSGYQRPPKDFVSGGNAGDYGQHLGQCDGFEQLDAIAKEAGTTPISDFMDDSGMLDDDEREEYGLPPAVPKWAAISDGIATLRVLVAALEKMGDDDTIGRYPAEAVLWDLQASLAILEANAASDERFHFDIG